MHVDSTFRTAHGKYKGSEDYALAGASDGWAYGVVCDGCGSSKHAALGSRLLALAIEREIKEWQANHGTFSPGVLHSLTDIAAKVVYNSLRRDFPMIEPHDYMATALSFATNGRDLFYCIWGDGMAIWSDGEMFHNCEVSFQLNAPYYPFYTCYQNKYLEIVDPKNESMVFIGTDGGQTADMVFLHEFVNTRKSVCGQLDCQDLDWFCLTTDGIESFQDEKPVSSGQIIQNLFQFASFNGDFIQRRMSAQFRRNEKAGLIHLDDFSVTGVSFKD